MAEMLYIWWRAHRKRRKEIHPFIGSLIIIINIIILSWSVLNCMKMVKNENAPEYKQSPWPPSLLPQRKLLFLLIFFGKYHHAFTSVFNMWLLFFVFVSKIRSHYTYCSFSGFFDFSYLKLKLAYLSVQRSHFFFNDLI